MNNPYDWNEEFLLVTFTAGRDMHTLLLDHATQSEFFERARTFTRLPGIISVNKLTEESFETLLPHFEENGRFVEGAS